MVIKREAHPISQSRRGLGIQFAKEMVTKHYGEEHVKDLAWDIAFITDDCG